MSIQHGNTLNPVTALEFYTTSSGPLILAGEGCFLKIFDSVRSSFLSECKVFDGQTIHGIVARHHGELLEDPQGEDLELVIWGGTFLRAFGRKDITALLRKSTGPEDSRKSDGFSKHSICTVSDWIIDVAITPHKPNECVLVTAHNTVLRTTFGKGLDDICIESLSSPSRSILYSAHLIWESENNLLVAAGTVFGEIILWQASVSTPDSRILHTFTGHEGSIFGVNISPLVPDKDGIPRRLLASCSDDRTIRIWELNFGKDLGGRLHDDLAARETGFGGVVNGVEASNRCLAMAMGHMSRIWSVEFIIRNSGISLLSFGEDATTQLWALNASKLTHLNTFAYNTGKHIWSRALRHDGSTVVATGGADGKISMFEIPTTASNKNVNSTSTEFLEYDNRKESSIQSRSWDLEEILADLPTIPISADQSSDSNTAPSDLDALVLEVESSPNASSAGGKPVRKPKPKKVPKDVMNRYAFVSDDQVLMTTTFGRVLLGQLGPCTQWKDIEMPDSAKTDLKSYSVAKSLPAIGVAFLGSASGNIFVYRKGCGTIQHFGKVSSKVVDMFAIQNGMKAELLVTTLGDQAATLFDCGQGLIPKSDSFSQNQRPVKLPECFVVTSAGRTKCGLLVLGSRKGGLAVYDPEKFDVQICSWTPNDAVPGDAITSIINVSAMTIDGDQSYFLTTCRDGTYSTFRLTSINPEISLVHQGTPPFGPMIEAAWFCGSDIMLYGFKSKSFIVWNETKKYEVSSIECGGAHRSFAYSPRRGSDGAGYFIYTKASKLYLHSQSHPSHQIIKAGGHGREIKACAVSDDGLIATGAEDTTIRIWRYEKHFDCLAVVQKHTTGIQHIQWHASRYLFSSGGNEEFFIWAVESIPGFGIGMVCEATCPDQSEEKDLRIMSFDVSECGGSGSTSNTRLLISLAYSDSTIRVYTYSKVERFRLVSKGRYTSSCLMQLRHLEIRGHELFLLAAATDGYLTVWKATIRLGLSEDGSDGLSKVSEDSRLVGASKEKTASSLALVSNHQVHQSSIKSHDIVRRNDQIVIATGGDDNALAITMYPNLDETPKSVILRSAHAAAITGLSFVSSSDDGEFRIVTSGNDQRIKEWDIDINADGLAIEEVGDVFTSVADVGDLTTLKDDASRDVDKVLVVGNGLEVYEYEVPRAP